MFSCDSKKERKKNNKEENENRIRLLFDNLHDVKRMTSQRRGCGNSRYQGRLILSHPSEVSHWVIVTRRVNPARNSLDGEQKESRSDRVRPSRTENRFILVAGFEESD